MKINKKGQMDIEVFEEPGFWILGGGAVIATILGYIWSRKMDWIPLPFWQLIIIIIVEIIAAAFFASREWIIMEIKLPIENLIGALVTAFTMGIFGALIVVKLL